MTKPNGRFDIEESRRYWRLAPSGVGKHDTSRLITASDDAFVRDWLMGFTTRFGNYLEEDFYLQTMAGEFAGRRVLSVGSGLGLHEIYYAARGARVTCCDIVETNLRTISRMSKLLGVDMSVFTLSDGSRISGGPFDVAFIYGSLMTMPAQDQRRLLQSCADSLSPGGRIVLMLYTWEFARATCGWSSPEEFDPAVFARASDESVGAEHCPWSDWHDDAKLLALAPPGFSISRRQFWQQDWFVWYELSPSPQVEGRPFFNHLTFLGSSHNEIPLAEFSPAAADVRLVESGLQVLTQATPAGYAALSPLLAPVGENALLIEAEIAEGAFSIGVLNEAGSAFLSSHVVRTKARKTHAFALPPLREPVRIVLSNHRDSPAPSEFCVRRIALTRASRASLGFSDQVLRRIRGA